MSDSLRMHELLQLLLDRVAVAEARVLAHECALRSILSHSGPAKSRLSAHLRDASVAWDQRVAKTNPRMDREAWRTAIDDLIATIEQGS